VATPSGADSDESGVDMLKQLHSLLPIELHGSATAPASAARTVRRMRGLCVCLAAASAWAAAFAQTSPEPQAAQAEPEEDVTSFEGGRFVLRRAADGECIIALQGTVTQSANYKFDDVVKKAKAQGCVRPITLMLESPGGLVDAGLSLGRSVHGEGMNTVARYACASSCANIFMGGSERILWGSRAEIGLHQPSFIREGDKRCVTTNFDVPVVAMRRYVRFVLPQTSDQIMAVVMSTTCNSITWVKGKRAIELGVATRAEAEDEDVFGPRAARITANASAPR
jgi:hypothetical protein